MCLSAVQEGWVVMAERGWPQGEEGVSVGGWRSAWWPRSLMDVATSHPKRSLGDGAVVGEGGGDVR